MAKERHIFSFKNKMPASDKHVLKQMPGHSKINLKIYTENYIRYSNSCFLQKNL